jgi:UDP-N-acetylenolpyruvoylglucosamine reductase
MNAGCYGYEISDYLISVKSIDYKGNIVIHHKDDLQFDFRESMYKKSKKYIILEATFGINTIASNNKDIFHKISTYKKHRHSILEYKFPNVGSIFKTTDIYSELSKTSKLYSIMLFLTRKVLYRIIRAKNNKLLNIFTLKFFKINVDCQLISDTTVNVVINNGCPTDAII